MTLRKLLIIGCLLGVWTAWASELRVAIVQGVGIRTFVGSPGGKYSVQCLSTDAGTDQKVFYRPGCALRPDAGVLCIADAGRDDIAMNFNPATGGSSDPYKIDLAPGEDRIHMSAADSPTIPIYCTVARRNP